MGIASADLEIMADRVRELRADARRANVSRSARQAYGNTHRHAAGRDARVSDGGLAAAAALRGLVQASLGRTDR